MKTSIKTKLNLYVGISIVLSTLVSSGFYFSKYYSEINSGITTRLTIGTELAKGTVPLDSLNHIREPEFKNSEVHAGTIRKLKEEGAAFGFKSVYLLIKEEDRIVFVFDSEDTSDAADDNAFLTDYNDAPDQIAAAFSSGEITTSEYTDKWGSFRSIFNPVKDSNGKIIAVIGADYEMSAVKEKLRAAYIVLALIICMGLILSVATAYLMNPLILKPILQIIGDISSISESADLSRRTSVKRDDEIGLLAASFNHFMDKSSFIIGQIEETALKLAASSEELASISASFTTTTQSQAENSKDVVTSSGAITDLINTIVQLSGEQLEIFVSQRKLIGELYTGIQSVNGQTEKTLSLSNAVASHAKKGEESLSLMNKSMDKVMESSNDMIGIIEIINDISDRINLLSLNAAIEAARAGNAGKGFAVVSEEISKLADQTASSTKNIDSLIKANSEEITREIESLHATTAVLKEIISGVEAMKIEVDTIQSATKEQLITAEKVRSNAGNIYKRAEDIKHTADNQKEELDRITQSVGKIDDNTGAVITGSEEIAASAEDLAGSAALLQEKISIFKL